MQKGGASGKGVIRKLKVTLSLRAGFCTRSDGREFHLAIFSRNANDIAACDLAFEQADRQRILDQTLDGSL